MATLPATKVTHWSQIYLYLLNYDLIYSLWKHIDSSPLNLTVTVELFARDAIDLPSLPPNSVTNKRLKLVIRWLHTTTGDYFSTNRCLVKTTCSRHVIMLSFFIKKKR